MEFDEIKRIDQEFQITAYQKMPISVERGKGTWVWTSEGEKYLDLYGGHAVCGAGHCHPHIVEAIKDQAEDLMFYSNLVYSSVRSRAAEKLIAAAPDSITKAFFCSSGTEANENAMRMARMRTGRENIVSFSGGFHGRTADSISATFLGKYREIGRPNVPHHIKAEFGSLESIRRTIDSDTAGVIIEPIQSMAGVREAPPEFFRELRELCDSRGAVLIFDEVQTGIGRTGSWFFAGSEPTGSVVPDIITLAKSLGNGVPVGACLVNDAVSGALNINDLGTTFGGGMLAMAAVLATLEAIENDDMIVNARSIENVLREELADAKNIVSIRGKGCLIGIEFAGPCRAVHETLLKNMIITGTSGDPNVLRLLPPLCTAVDDIAAAASIIKETSSN